MKLLPNWKKAWKWFSVQFIAAASIVQLVLLSFPITLQMYIPNSVMQVLVLVLLAGAIMGRLVDQTKA